MARRITIPVKGGLYKSVKVDTQQSAGTTISGFDNQIITLDQLRAALGLTNKASVTPPSGGGTSGSLIVAPGLVGGGPLVGTVPLRINKAQAAAMFVGGGGDDDGGGSGSPGKRGKDGAQGPIGANGAAGTPGGPRGRAIATVVEADEADLPMPVRGRRGATGATGLQGAAGRTKIWLPDNDYEEQMFVYPKRSVAATVATVSLSAAILADTPFAFWKCDDASTSITDSSGNGFNLTTIMGSLAYQDSPLIPSLPTTKFLNVGGYTNTSVASGASLASSLGQTLPLTTWTIECIVSQFATTSISRFIDWRTAGSGNAVILALYNNGAVLSVAINASNVPLNAGAGIINGKPCHIVVTCTTVSTTSTFTVYLNGLKVGGTTSTASLASGGTPTIGIGDYAFGGTTCGEILGYVALYSSALPIARIVAHAQAAGLFGL